jgi:hypothetical protein
MNRPPGRIQYYTATSLDGGRRRRRPERLDRRRQGPRRSVRRAGLLDDVLVTIARVTLGGVAPLLPRRLELRLEELGRNGDFACARFAVVRDA